MTNKVNTLTSREQQHQISIEAKLI